MGKFPSQPLITGAGFFGILAVRSTTTPEVVEADGLDAETDADASVVVVNGEADADEGVVDDEADADDGVGTVEGDFFTAKKDGLLWLHSAGFEQCSLYFVQCLK